MPSHPIDVLTCHLQAHSDTQTLRDVFATITDPRHERGKRFQLVDVLTLCQSAVLSGAKSFAAIHDWATIHLTLPATTTKVPSRDSIRRILHLVDADELDRMLGDYFLALAPPSQGNGPIVVAIDGKELRGAKNGGGAPVLSLLSCFGA